MSTAVYKFGGTSLDTREKMELCFERIEKGLKEGKKIAVVVSAMGRAGDAYSTDSLLSLASEGNQSLREKALLFSCGEIISGCVFASEMRKMGLKACFLTGSDAEIVTTGGFSHAEIDSIDTRRVLKLLNEGYIPVVAGCQGKDKNNFTTSLQRGGSDITAAALGYYLRASEIRIFTDVAGIFTSDPKTNKDSVLLDKISFDECRNLALKGAEVINPAALDFAEKGHIPLYIVPFFKDGKGTLIE